MLHIDPATGMLSVPVWLSAAVAAVVLVLAILAIARSGIVKTLFALAILAVVGYGGWLGSQIFERGAVSERVEERRAFDRSVAELTGRATVPGSPLSCLDGAAIEPLTAGCEKILFGSPENVTAAVSYATARIALLNEGLELASRSDQNFDSALNILRQGLEADRFGVVAHVMGQQPNCLPQQCEMLVLLQDANKVRANLQDKPFEALVAKYSPQWGTGVRVGGIEGTRSPIAVVPGAAPPAPISSRYDLPSSASIPPVSIMNTESSNTPASPSAGQTSSTPAAQPPAARRPPAVRAPVARSAHPPQEPPPPVPLAPAGTGGPAPAQINPPSAR
jgi:hypothetical protein